MTLTFKQRLALYDPNINDLKSRAKFGIIPLYLRADDIAELWAEGAEFSKEAYQRFIKEQIEDGQLACMTIGQWIEAMDEKQKEPHKYARPSKVLPPQKGNSISFAMGVIGCLDCSSPSDYVPEDRVGGYLGDTSGMSVQEKDMATRLYMVNRTEFKKWLEKNEEWPLPEKCLLARWWASAEGDEEANALQAAATKQQEKAIQVLINRVVQANPEARPVYIWNKLKEYDTDGIILKQEPETIEGITGNEDAFIEYTEPVRGTPYKPIKLKAFQTRCTQARKELGLNSKP
jgi:hypothetical protein